MKKGVYSEKTMIISFSVSFFLLILSFILPIFCAAKLVIRIITFGIHRSCFIKAYNTYCCYKNVYLICYFLNFTQFCWFVFYFLNDGPDCIVLMIASSVNFTLNTFVIVNFEFFYRKNLTFVENDEQLFLHVL